MYQAFLNLSNFQRFSGIKLLVDVVGGRNVYQNMTIQNNTYLRSKLRACACFKGGNLLESAILWVVWCDLELESTFGSLKICSEVAEYLRIRFTSFWYRMLEAKRLKTIWINRLWNIFDISVIFLHTKSRHGSKCFLRILDTIRRFCKNLEIMLTFISNKTPSEKGLPNNKQEIHKDGGCLAYLLAFCTWTWCSCFDND